MRRSARVKARQAHPSGCQDKPPASQTSGQPRSGQAPQAAAVPRCPAAARPQQRWRGAVPHLDPGIWQQVVSHLDYRDRAAAALTCRAWRDWAWTPPLPILRIGTARDVAWPPEEALEPWAAKYGHLVKDMRATLNSHDDLDSLAVLLDTGASLRKLANWFACDMVSYYDLRDVLAWHPPGAQELVMENLEGVYYEWPLPDNWRALRHLRLELNGAWSVGSDITPDAEDGGCEFGLDGAAGEYHPDLRVLYVGAWDLSATWLMPDTCFAQLHTLCLLGHGGSVEQLQYLTHGAFPRLQRLAVVVTGSILQLVTETALGSLTTLTALCLSSDNAPGAVAAADMPLHRLTGLQELTLRDGAVGLMVRQHEPGELLPAGLQTLLLCKQGVEPLSVVLVEELARVPTIVVGADALHGWSYPGRETEEMQVRMRRWSAERVDELVLECACAYHGLVSDQQPQDTFLYLQTEKFPWGLASLHKIAAEQT